jgi:hypothetical protein
MTLMDAIQQGWPDARCVVRGESLERWDDDRPRPSDAELAEAIAAYVPPVYLTAAKVIAELDPVAVQGLFQNGRHIKALLQIASQRHVDVTEPAVAEMLRDARAEKL